MSSDEPVDQGAFLEAMAPEPDEQQRRMAERAEEEGFPIVGPAVGGVLYQLVMMVGASRIFEFGSGFGYSAYWFARAMHESGMVVLTEEDANELDAARTYFDRGDLDHLARFELGDALDTIHGYDGPFDIVLIDHDKERYLDAFELIRGRIPPGGVIVADNAISAGPMDTPGLMAAVVGDEDQPDLDEMTDGIRRYLQAVRRDTAFATVVLPLGSGIAVSVRRPG